MTEQTAQTLDPLTLPLTGARLIEASAGTGKTYTIAALYLRLLLGLGGEAAYPRPLGVEELLVVTFTEAATEELRSRIRDNIHALRIACLRGQSDNPLFLSLLEEIRDREQAARVLLLAERQMDEAAIFTIHGFCQRMLNLNAFESGMLFEQQLLEDEHQLRYQACADFWRRHCYPLSKPVAQAISTEWSGPRALLRDINRYLQGEAPRLRQPPAEGETLPQRHARIIATIDAIKQLWRAAAPDIAAIIADSGVDKRSFSSRNLPNWLSLVGEWAARETTDYQVPEALGKFAQSFLDEKTKKGEPPRHGLFSAIDAFLSEPLTLRDLVIARAMAEIRYSVAREKRRRGEMGFDDMLSRLDDALRQPAGEALADAIRARFPAAMIDEFQDTDPQQYRIFRRIWLNQPVATLLLIGDPKQAIYAFRGADIFTYMTARSEVTAHYTLETNWRSAPGMVHSVNRLFGQLPHPFLFRQIPFLPVSAAKKNHRHRFTLNGSVQPAMTLWHTEGEGCGVSEYQQIMARQCAREIRDWLSAGARGEARLWSGNDSRAVQASDITVLVRSRNEAAIVRDALGLLNIQSVYLSNRDSVFLAPEAREILWILQAVLAPEHEQGLRSAMATSILGLDARAIDALSQQESQWDALVEEFSAYREIWQRRGVMPMMRALLAQRHVAENILASPAGERRLTDILHISELLQEAAARADSEHALVRWLAQHIEEPDTSAASQQLRLESDRHLVKVVTIHKSKGLEYPLVWLPFIASYRQETRGLYHDRQTFETLLDPADDTQSLALAEEERLAEDLRLLYVALTRSVWHCSLGVAPLFRGNRSKKGATDFHHSAIGLLIQQGQAMDALQLAEALLALSDDDIHLQPTAEGDETPWQPPQPDSPPLAAREPGRPMADNWRVTSYSGLQQHGRRAALDWVPRLDEDAVGEALAVQETPGVENRLTIHHFPRGASPGTFLHGLLEELDFTQPPDPQWLLAQLLESGFDGQWQPVVMHWLEQLLIAPLNEQGLCLAELAPADKRAELAFYLPIASPLQARQLDQLIRAGDPLSAGCPPLDFRQVQGMLKGFIDLVFRHNGRYYLLDYKSNWLGEDASAYTPQAMAGAMQEHRYDLQYQLYTLALHRFLRHRIADYDYQRHFGGVIYLFLRGVDPASVGQGVYTARPSLALVNALDALFAGDQPEENP